MMRHMINISEDVVVTGEEIARLREYASDMPNSVDITIHHRRKNLFVIELYDSRSWVSPDVRLVRIKSNHLEIVVGLGDVQAIAMLTSYRQKLICKSHLSIGSAFVMSRWAGCYYVLLKDVKNRWCELSSRGDRIAIPSDIWPWLDSMASTIDTYLPIASDDDFYKLVFTNLEDDETSVFDKMLTKNDEEVTLCGNA